MLQHRQFYRNHCSCIYTLKEERLLDNVFLLNPDWPLQEYSYTLGSYSHGIAGQMLLMSHKWETSSCSTKWTVTNLNGPMRLNASYGLPDGYVKYTRRPIWCVGSYSNTTRCNILYCHLTLHILSFTLISPLFNQFICQHALFNS